VVAGGRRYVPLSKLGIPSATLCSVVSSLLDTGGTPSLAEDGYNNEVDDDNCYSLGYASVKDVEEALARSDGVPSQAVPLRPAAL